MLGRECRYNMGILLPRGDVESYSLNAMTFSQNFSLLYVPVSSRSYEDVVPGCFGPCGIHNGRCCSNSCK
jgi:hypothetical protein